MQTERTQVPGTRRSSKQAAAAAAPGADCECRPSDQRLWLLPAGRLSYTPSGRGALQLHCVAPAAAAGRAAHLLDELRSCILHRVGQLNGTSDGHAIIDDLALQQSSGTPAQVALTAPAQRLFTLMHM